MKLADKAQYVLNNLTMATPENYHPQNVWHALHPITGASLCNDGRRAILGSHRSLVMSVLNCKKCNAIIVNLKRAANETR